MRKLLWVGLLGGGVTAGRERARLMRAHGACRANAGFGSIAEICHFNTFEACRDERSHWGTTAFCSQNPRFLPYWQGAWLWSGARPGAAVQEEAPALAANTPQSG